MLHFRNTYKNSKLMVLYGILSILFFVFSTIAFLFTFIDEFRVLSIIFCVIFSIIFIISFFLLVMKNNNYKLKYFFKLNRFYKDFKAFKSVSSGNKNTISEIKKQQKDYFLQFGECTFEDPKNDEINNPWNCWVEDAVAFSFYPYAEFMEKLSYLTFVLYHACESGGGLEEFFRWVSNEPFKENEIKEIITKDDFFSKKFKKFLIKILDEYNDEKQDELFERYELQDNEQFYSFQQEIINCSNWMSRNRFLLSSCVGIYLHGNINFDMYRLFLSKDYNKIVYIYSPGNEMVRVSFQTWDEESLCWNGVKDSSIYDCVETAFNDIKHELAEYIEISI